MTTPPRPTSQEVEEALIKPGEVFDIYSPDIADPTMKLFRRFEVLCHEVHALREELAKLNKEIDEAEGKMYLVTTRRVVQHWKGRAEKAEGEGGKG